MPKQNKKQIAKNPEPTTVGLPPRYLSEKRHAVHENWVNIQRGLTDAQVKSVTQAYANGQWQSVGNMFEQLFREESIRLAIQKRVDSFISIPTKIVSPTEDPQDIEFAKFIEYKYEQIFPQASIEYLLKQRLLLNTCVGTLAWCDGVPQLHGLHAMWLWNHPIDNSWWYLTRDEGRIVVDLEWEDKDKLKSVLEQQIQTQNISNIEGNPSFIFWSTWHRGSFDAPLVSLAGPCFQAMIMREKWIESGRFYSSPIQILHVPEGAEEVEIDAFVSEYKLNAENKIVVVKNIQGTQNTQPWSVEVIDTSKSADPTLYKTFIDDFRRQVQIAFLHGNLSTEVSEAGGNRAASEVHAEIERQLTINDFKWFNEIARTQIFRLMAQQFNPFNPPNVPNIIPDFTSQIDISERVNSLQTFIQLLNDLKNTDYEINNVEELSNQYGISLKKRQIKQPEIIETPEEINN